MGRNGMVSTSHPFATLAALDMLRAGGSAMDAAITAAAVLSVVEPMMTGLGGDVFMLIYESQVKRIRGLNGSGRAPTYLSREHFGNSAEINLDSWESVTVPGAVDAWAVALQRFGTQSFKDVLLPAIHYAEEGFPVTEAVARLWAENEEALNKDEWAKLTYLPQGRAPQPGEVFQNPNLAKSLRLIAEGGRDAFYRGPIAKEIVRYADESGGFLKLDDFRSHESAWVSPLSANYRGYEVFQCPPNGQGLAVLMMLNMLSGLEINRLRHNSAEYLHLLIEMKKLAYADLERYVSDPDRGEVPVIKLLSKGYLSQRMAQIDPRKAAPSVPPGRPFGRDTVCLSVVDRERNAVSLIQSIFHPFGSKIVGGDTGILLHNRGAGFSLQRDHPNEYSPLKRPFHTIIPGMVLLDGAFHMSYGVTGGSMQPQGHLQFLLNHLDFGMNLQEAIDCPRWRHTEGVDVKLEHGHPRAIAEVLHKLGHRVFASPGSEFGGAHAVMIDPETGTFLGAADPRKDGCALGF
jgi:gamma-glutamyltranspeptidase/glutathione hydrolase